MRKNEANKRQCYLRFFSIDRLALNFNVDVNFWTSSGASSSESSVGCKTRRRFSGVEGIFNMFRHSFSQ